MIRSHLHSHTHAQMASSLLELRETVLTNVKSLVEKRLYTHSDTLRYIHVYSQVWLHVHAHARTRTRTHSDMLIRHDPAGNVSQAGRWCCWLLSAVSEPRG